MERNLLEGREGKNCHEYCPYRKQCRFREGEVGLDPDDCSMYYKLDDLMNDARMEEKEEAFEAEDDWE